MLRRFLRTINSQIPNGERPYLLALPQFGLFDIQFERPLSVGRSSDGTEIPFNPLDEHSFGRSFLKSYGHGLRWTAKVQPVSLAEVGQFQPFHGGALVSPVFREEISQFSIPNCEFIPIDIISSEGKRLDEWYFLNVFNWVDLIDFDASEYESVPFHEDYDSGVLRISRSFGDRGISKWTRLTIKRGNLSDDIFLVKAPTSRIWGRVFVSTRLARALRAMKTKWTVPFFQKIPLTHGPNPDFEKWTG